LVNSRSIEFLFLYTSKQTFEEDFDIVLGWVSGRVLETLRQLG